MEKAIIAMSGGVDSSVCGCLTIKQGYECIGATLKLYDKETQVGDTRRQLDDINDAKSVAEKLGIPHYVFNYRDEFKEKVIIPFINSYKKGETPNPCIECNKYLKFSKLLAKADELGIKYIATGHYAIVEKRSDGRFVLKKAIDLSKDQSYVLYNLTQEQLSRVIFPLGTLTKTEARQIAEENGFVNAHKSDSQDICFIPDGKYAEFIENYTKEKFSNGDFVDKNGKVLGEHKGIIRYTIGQRKGLGLALPHPMYVLKKDMKNNRVILCDNDDLFTADLDARNVNLIAIDEINEPIRVKAKVRYKQTEQWATVSNNNDGTYHVKFDEPQRAIASGQAVVFYDGDIVVGGGTII